MGIWLSKWAARGSQEQDTDEADRAAPPARCAVAIAGGGPAGLMLAGELALAGVDVAIVERRASQALAGSRAGGLHARTLELLDQRGIVERFLAQGQAVQALGFAGATLDLAGFPTRHAYSLGLWQNHIERLLAQWLGELGVPVRYGREVVDFAQDASGVDIALSDGGRLRAQYLVGCDGGRSRVRRLAGIAFPGCPASCSHLIAEVETTQAPPLGVHRNAFGLHSFGREQYTIRDGAVVFAEQGPVRVLVSEAQLGTSREPSLDELRAALVAACGSDYGAHSPTRISRFTDAARQAEAYRERRVLLAGDAAHVHAPDGGQGLQLGVQDAVNLGWKLAQVVRGLAPHTLLDSYHAERHPVAAQVLRTTLAATALRRPDERTAAVREVLAGLLALEPARVRMAAQLSGLDIRYDFGQGHPLLGRRMPDLDLRTSEGPVRTYALLRAAQPVLLELGLPGGFDLAPWADRVRQVRAQCEDRWELPVVGPVGAPGAVLVRPDGYVAWVGESDWRGLAEALTRWFGPPRAG